MELEQLQQAWKELNEHVQQNELVHQQQIREMLTRQKESSLQKILRIEKTALLFLIILSAGMAIIAYTLPSDQHLIAKFWPFIVLILGIGLTVAILSCRKLSQILKEENLERQVRNMLQYKRIMNHGYLAGNLSVIPFIACFLYYYSFLWPVVAFVLLAGLIIDYFLIHYLTDRIKEFSQINKELADLDD